MNIEIERKFLIEIPCAERLIEIDGCTVKNIVQTYLEPINDAERRIRQVTENERVSYIYTEKRKCEGSTISRFEDEREITEDEYRTLYADAYSELCKTRYAFPYEGHTVEIDVYPDRIGGELLCGRAVLEVELDSEDEEIALPDFIRVIGEVTGERAYSNKKLAKKK